MADDPDEQDALSDRLDRIEQLLRRPPAGSPPLPAGPDVRSARSIVNRVDDVWVAVTEGNERVERALDSLRADVAAVAAAMAGLEGSVKPQHRIPVTGLHRTGDTPGTGDDNPAGTAAPGTAAPGTDVGGGAEPGLYLRLNRIEEALAGIAARLDAMAPAPAASGPARRRDADAGSGGPATQGRWE